jgi:hypothetical protein
MPKSQDSYEDALFLNKIRLMLRTMAQPGKPGHLLKYWMINNLN